MAPPRETVTDILIQAESYLLRQIYRKEIFDYQIYGFRQIKIINQGCINVNASRFIFAINRFTWNDKFTIYFEQND